MDTRSQLLHDIFHIPEVTLEAVRALRQRARAWLEKHPDDQEVLECGEMLVMLESGFLIEP